MAVYDLGLSPAEAWRATPREVSLLMHRHEEALMREESIAGLLAALLANPHRKKNARPAQPHDFFPRLREADSRPDWVKLKEAFGFG